MTVEAEIDDWLDDSLLTDDPPSPKNWRQIARGGIGYAQAITALPKNGQILTYVPIESWRAFREVCRAVGETPARFAARSIGARLAQMGVDPVVVADFEK